MVFEWHCAWLQKVDLIKYGLSLPLHIAVAKAFGIAKKHILGLWLKKARALEETYAELITVSPDQLKRCVQKNYIAEQFTLANQKALTHEFDLLYLT